MWNNAAVCGGRMELIFLWGTNMRFWSPLRVSLLWFYRLPWCVESIVIPCYWWVSNPTIARPCHILNCLLGRNMLCASTLGHLSYPQRLGRGLHVPVSGYSCRLIFLRQGTTVGLVLAKHAIQGVCTSNMPYLCHFTLQSHIYRHQTTVWLLESWILCCLLALISMWPIGGYLSWGVGPVCARTGFVVGPNSFLFSEGGVMDSGITSLGLWCVQHDWDFPMRD